AAEPQAGGREVSAAKAARKTLAYDFFRFLYSPQEDGEIYVGIMSGGRLKVPVGTVQLRIDQNDAWTITPQETPVSMAPSIPMAPLVTLQGEQAALVNNAQEQAMKSTSQLMSSYTVTGGDKAKQILKQMVSGHMIKYRTVGINQAASINGEAVIDPSLVKSLREIGIEPDHL
ncbi:MULTISPECIES: hypothetical protein, partial [Pseudomonas]|uniref:hypothetical protein n=1 Tax=Pseudomonas TaxID=286 RepID=UPI002F26158A